MTKLFWTPDAIQDRDNIYDYIETENPSAALDLDQLFEEKSALLINRPNLGRIGRVSETRELVANRNYLLIYDVTDNLIRILNVVHTARQWPPLSE